MRCPVFLLFMLLVPASTVARAAGRETAAVRLRLVVSSAAHPRVLFPQARFRLSARRPGNAAAPTELSKRARFAVVKLGATTLTLTFDAPQATPALGLLYAGGKSAIGRVRPQGKDGFTVEFSQALCGNLICNVRLGYRKGKFTGGAIELARHMRGKAVLGGVVRDVVLVDADADGKFNGKADRWIALRADRAGAVKTIRRPAALLLGEPQIPFEPDGRALMVEHVAADGRSLALVLDQPGTSVRAVLRRRYREVRADHFRDFEREMVDFVARQELDPKRPFAKKTAVWKSMSLAKAKALAKKKGMPLLVNFYTETNAWSYRYDFYTFPDAEIDALLRKFVLVRIDAEKDPKKAYQKTDARGLPTLMPFTSRGAPVAFRVRNRDKDLRKKERMITGWQRPQELAINLKRILKACSER